MTDCTPSADSEPRDSTDVAPVGAIAEAVGAAEALPAVSHNAACGPAPEPALEPAPRSGCSGARFHWRGYLLKAASVIGALFLFSRVVAMAPGWCVALFWAAASLFLAVGVTYHAVVKKTVNQVKYQDGGIFARLNEGRTLRLVIAFVVSAACVAGLIVASARWELWTWALAVVAIPLVALVFLLVDKAVRAQMSPLCHASASMLASVGIAGAILCALGMALFMLQPVSGASDATAAFLSVSNPFASSPSALMAEAGLASSYADTLSAYGVTKVGQVSTFGRYAAELALQASAYFGLAGLLGVCLLDWRELKRVFSPLERMGSIRPFDTAPADEPAARELGRPARKAPSILPQTVAASVLAPVCLVAAFMVTDASLAQMQGSEELTLVENAARDAFGTAVYALDGQYYDQQAVQAAMDVAEKKSAELSEEVRSTLVPLINETFDTRVANVDSYLDWYYSLGADFERLVNLITGSIEEFVGDQLAASLEEGVDESQFMQAMQGYVDEAASISAEYEEALAACGISDMPEWLATSIEQVGGGFFDGPIEPAERLLDAGERFGVSASVGVAGGVVAGKALTKAGEKIAAESAEKAAVSAAVDAAEGAAEKTAGKQAAKAAEKSAAKSIASKITEKAAEKSFFKAIVSRISSMLASRGVGAAVGTVAGGAAGSIVPGAGTAAGAVAGAVAGAAISVGVDWAALKIDEAQNREEYKSEIVEAIEEERSEVLALVE